jgi:hypothetical protein
MILETAAINVRKGSSDECGAAFAFRACHKDNAAMCADSAEGDGLIAYHWSISLLAEDLAIRAARIVAWQDQAINP